MQHESRVWVDKKRKAVDRTSAMTNVAPGPPYDAPPIIEAVIQIRYVDPVSKTLQAKLLKRLKREYRNELALQAVGANVDFENQQAAFVAEPQARLSSIDETDVLIVHSTTLTWSRLAPYQGWDALLERVKRDIQIAYEVTGLRKIAQLGARYINRIDVPINGQITRYEDYLTINLSLPPTWDGVSNYGWRFERLYPELNSIAIVQSAIIAPELPNHAAFLLDIDIICNHDIPAKNEDIFRLLGKMRDLKNEIFELSITDMARVSFKK
jgi:uncharacterized protein (TIGR04255 family)